MRCCFRAAQRLNAASAAPDLRSSGLPARRPRANRWPCHATISAAAALAGSTVSPIWSSRALEAMPCTGRSIQRGITAADLASTGARDRPASSRLDREAPHTAILRHAVTTLSPRHCQLIQSLAVQCDPGRFCCRAVPKSPPSPSAHSGANTPVMLPLHPRWIGQRPQQVEDRACPKFHARSGCMPHRRMVPGCERGRHNSAARKTSGRRSSGVHRRSRPSAVNEHRRRRCRRQRAVAVPGNRHVAASHHKGDRGGYVEHVQAEGRRRYPQTSMAPASEAATVVSRGPPRRTHVAPVILRHRLACAPASPISSAPICAGVASPDT